VSNRNMDVRKGVEGQVRITKMRRIQSAFTLIELLTVIAITAILMTIIVLPIFQSFNLMRTAQAYSDAQDKARVLIEKIQREFNNGAAVADNSGLNGSIALVVPTCPAGVYGQETVITQPYLKVDIYQPAEGEPSGTPGVFINPYTGKVDPTLRSPRGQTIFPVSQGFTIVRYFVGLASPFEFDAANNQYLARRYNNPYDGLLMERRGGRDNLYVLYRAEVQPRVWDSGLQRYVANTALFNANANGEPILNDPAFFALLPVTDYDMVTRVLTPAGNAKRVMMSNWLKRATIQTEISRYDMVQPIYDKKSRQVPHDMRPDPMDLVAPLDEWRPRLLSTIQLRPTRVNGEPAEGKMAVRLGNEMENAKETGPDVFVTDKGAWSQATVRIYPSGWDRTNVNFDEYLVERVDPADGHIKIFCYDPGSGVADNIGGTAVFDVTEYYRVLANPTPGDVGPFNTGVLPAAGGFQSLFMGFLPDTAQGKVTASFGIDTVRSTTFSVPLPGGATMNQPVVPTGAAFSPLNDPAPGPWASATSINQRFNRIWNDPTYAGLKPDKIHRFIDLRVTPQLDGSMSPLDPTGGFGRAKIVPGSDIVIGPDQNPGPNYGEPVRYTRTTRAPGPNQYKINYVDLQEPDYSLYGLSAPPAAYTAGDFSSAIFQPRFKVGYIQLNSDPNVPLPDGNIRAYFRFQFTGGVSAGSIAGINAGGARQDAVAVDYDTRQLMSILLTIRNYPQSNVPNPQMVTLSATAKVRNYLR
jgi:prepilin-type N-terminal cleavage/methylation domain-containing protein